jgi:hypothetical protein
LAIGGGCGSASSGLEALLWKGKHPLVSSVAEVKSIEFVPMPDELRTLEQGKQFIVDLPRREAGHLYIIRSIMLNFLSLMVSWWLCLERILKK